MAAILLIAGYLRLGGITDVGIRYDDEGAYAADARLWHRCATVLFDADALRAVVRGDKKSLRLRMGVLGIDSGDRYEKPSQGFTFLGALTMFFVRDAPSSLLLVNGLCGALAVAVLYGLAASLFSRTVALMASLSLALSPFHIVYCRSALADATAGLFIMLGVSFWVRGRTRGWSHRRTYGVSGLFLGYAALCHSRSLFAPAVIVLADLLGCVGRAPGRAGIATGWRWMPRSWAWLTLGGAAPILIVEGLFRLVRFAAWATDSYLPLTTFLEGAWHTAALTQRFGAAISGHEFWRWNPRVLPAYVEYFVHWHGAAAGFIALFGMAVVLLRKGIRKVAALMIIVPAVILSFQPYPVARAVSPTIPFLCLSLAVGIHGIATVVTRRQAGAAAGLCLLGVLILSTAAFERTLDLRQKQSHIANALRTIEDRGGGVVAVPADIRKYGVSIPDQSHSITLVNGQDDRTRTSPEAFLSALRGQGVRWFITDPQRWHYNITHAYSRRVFRWWQAMDRVLHREALLVARFAHLSDYRWEFLAEGPGVQWQAEMTRRGAGPLCVYDLQAQSADESRRVARQTRRRVHPIVATAPGDR